VSYPASPSRHRAGVLAWVAILAIGTVHALVVASLPRHSDWILDLRAYLDAAQRLVDGQPLYQALTTGGPFTPGPAGLYLYAPPFAVAMIPFAAATQSLAVIAWQLVHELVLIASCALMPIRPRLRVAIMVVAACSVPPLRDTVLGNVSLLTLFAAVIGWRWLDRPLGSIAIGLVLSIRTTFGLFLVWWLLRRRWQALLWALLAYAVATLVSLPLVGVDSYADYLRTLRNISDVGHAPFSRSIAAILLRNGTDPGVADLVQLATYAVAIVAVLASLRRDRELSYVVTVAATVVLSPLLWQHYGVLFLVPAAFLAQRGRPLALVLPLLVWLPELALPILALVAVVLPFLAPPGRALAAGRGRAFPIDCAP
jgi:alpha-1,2-mannosyltransferase